MIESQAEFARRCKTTRQSVGKWITRGLIGAEALVHRDGKVLVDVERAQAHLAARRHPGQALGNGAKTAIPERKSKRAAKGTAKAAKPSPATSEPEAARELPTAAAEPDGEPDFQFERARLTRAQAENAEHKNRILLGEMIPARVAELRWAAEMVAMRQSMLALPGEIAGALPHLSKNDLAAVDRCVRDAMTRAAETTDDPAAD